MSRDKCHIYACAITAAAATGSSSLQSPVTSVTKSDLEGVGAYLKNLMHFNADLRVSDFSDNVKFANLIRVLVCGVRDADAFFCQVSSCNNAGFDFDNKISENLNKKCFPTSYVGE